jgi:hypothetical protein
MNSPSATQSPDIRAFLHERLDAMLDDCNKIAGNAAYGRYIHDLDDFLYTEGRKFMREVLEQQVQDRIQQVESTDEGKQCPKCKKKTTAHTRPGRTIISSHGSLKFHRRYRYCKPCNSYSYPVESLLGLDADYTDGLKRLVGRGGGQWSYRLVSDNIEAYCGFRLSHATMGKIAAQTADELATRMQDDPTVREKFQQAKGETEFYADGVFVHIRNDEGKAEWCEAKTGAYAKRTVGESATPEEWGSRDLPKPTIVSAFAAIESKAEFQERCQRERRRLGVGGVASTLADGAVWIWSLFFWLLGRTAECLDIYHAAEHISDCGKVLFGAGQEAKEWFERMRLVLLSEGFEGIERELLLVLASISQEEKEKGKEKTKTKCEAVTSLLEYFRKNKDRLKYRERLAQGRAIGSGLVEGACKNLVGKRLVQTGACWRKERANKIAVLAALLYSDQWKHCWKMST